MPSLSRRPVAAAGGVRLPEIPAARYGCIRRGLQAQPPHRAEVDGTVVDDGLRSNRRRLLHLAPLAGRGRSVLLRFNSTRRALVAEAFHLRRYRAEDEEAAIALWQLTWQRAYPEIDFAARVSWWRERWRGELVPDAAIIIAEQAGVLVGFVTIDTSGYLDQLVVVPDLWGSELADTLVNEAKRLSSNRIALLVNTDNIRAIRFYERNGFVRAGEDVNPTSGRPVLRMEWMP